MCSKYFLLIILPNLFFSANSLALNTPDCRSTLSKLVCIVDSPASEKDRFKPDRRCEKDERLSAKFLLELQKAYDRYPPFIQKQVCNLSKIYVEKHFFGNAWSDTGLIAINQGLVTTNPSQSDALSGFEQLTFGGREPGYSSSLSFPKIMVSPTGPEIDHTLLHEIGHTFDYVYDFQRKGWQALSWKDGSTPLQFADFNLRKHICLNNCHGKFISIEQISEFYKELVTHGFVSQLSAVASYEDFAETFAFTVEKDILGQNLTISTGKETLDPFSSQQVSKKMAYMRHVLSWLSEGAQGDFARFQGN